MSDKENEGFVRQRRNLMIVSLVLLFSEATDLKVDKISAFGNDLLIGKPQAVTAALWVAAAYWLIRFYQYSHASYSGSIKNVVQSYIMQYDVLWPAIQRRLCENDPSLLEPISNTNAIPRLQCTQYGGIEFKRGYLRANVTVSKTDDTTTVELENQMVRVDGADLSWLHVRAWIHLILHTTLFTELLLPYIVFALPVIYAGYKLILKLAA